MYQAQTIIKSNRKMLVQSNFSNNENAFYFKIKWKKCRTQTFLSNIKYVRNKYRKHT